MSIFNKLQTSTNYLWNNPPRAIVKKIKQKIYSKTSRFQIDYQENEVLNSKHTDFMSLIDRWHRMHLVIKNKFNENLMFQTSQFEGMNYLEIGSGPLGGFAPMAIFFKAKSVYCIEPNITKNLLHSETFFPFLSNFYDELSFMYGSIISKEEFIQKVKDIKFINHKEIPDKIDLVFSLSVLEHLSRNELDELLSSIKHAEKSIHIVDFSPHKTPNTLSSIHYFPKTDSNVVNQLKPSEILLKLKENTSQQCHFSPYRIETFLKEKIHTDWEKYTDTDLSTLLGIFIIK